MPLSRRHFIALVSAVPIGAAVAPAAFAQTAPVYAERGIAVDGTDVVAYFNEGKPVKGSASFTFEWNGAVWQFSNAENRNMFAAAPETYAPQYGGYCSYAVSQGYTASTTPEAWKIVDGKLYLNYSRRIQRRWELDIPGRIEAANKNWPEVLNR